MGAGFGVPRRTQIVQSFLLLFFKKEVLVFLSTLPLHRPQTQAFGNAVQSAAALATVGGEARRMPLSDQDEKAATLTNTPQARRPAWVEMVRAHGARCTRATGERPAAAFAVSILPVFNGQIEE